MTRPPRRRLPNRAARRADVLRALADAAKELVCDGETFADLSVERLSRQAGISRASFYLYFEDKGELVRGWHDLVDESAQEILKNWWHATAPSQTLIADVFSRMQRLHRDSRVALVAIEEMTASYPDLRRVRDATFRRRHDALHAHIIDGQAGGWVDPDIDAATTAAWLAAMVDRVMQLVAPTTDDDSDLYLTGADIIWQTLYRLPRRQ